MLAPTPMLRPSPIDVGGLFSGSFQALRQRFGLFILIELLPMIVGVVFFGAGVVIVVASGTFAAISQTSQGLPAGLLAAFVLFFVGGFATALAQLKSYGMMSVAAYEIAQGTRPDFRGLLTRTRGFLPRMAPVIAIAIGAVALFYALFFGLTFGVFGAVAASTSRSGSNGVAALAGLFGIMALLFLILIPVGYFLMVKLLYTIPATAIEQVGGIDGMKRSWTLTKGAFWRTFGYYILAALAVGAIAYIVGMVGQVALLPAMARIGTVGRGSDPTEIFNSLALFLPAYLLVIGLQVVIQLLTTPFLQAYMTYMFIDQVRRSEMPPAAAYGYGGTPYGQQPGVPQYYAQPGQYYGQPGQQNPPQAPQQYPPQPPQQGQWPPAPPGQQPPATP